MLSCSCGESQSFSNSEVHRVPTSDEQEDIRSTTVVREAVHLAAVAVAAGFVPSHHHLEQCPGQDLPMSCVCHQDKKAIPASKAALGPRTEHSVTRQ